MVAFASGSLVSLWSSHCPGMQSSQGLIGARESASKLTHIVAGMLWLLTGCWPEVVVPHQWVSSQGCSQHGNLLPQEQKIRELNPKGKAHLYNLILKSDILSLLPYGTGHRDQPWCSVGGDYARV